MNHDHSQTRDVSLSLPIGGDVASFSEPQTNPSEMSHFGEQPPDSRENDKFQNNTASIDETALFYRDLHRINFGICSVGSLFILVFYFWGYIYVEGSLLVGLGGLLAGGLSVIWAFGFAEANSCPSRFFARFFCIASAFVVSMVVAFNPRHYSPNRSFGENAQTLASRHLLKATGGSFLSLESPISFIMHDAHVYPGQASPDDRVVLVDDENKADTFRLATDPSTFSDTESDIWKQLYSRCERAKASKVGGGEVVCALCHDPEQNENAILVLPCCSQLLHEVCLYQSLIKRDQINSKEYACPFCKRPDFDKN